MDLYDWFHRSRRALDKKLQYGVPTIKKPLTGHS
jgi:hypothetical protein